jgi:hypothetical protein
MSQVTDKFITLCCIEYTSPWTGFKLTTLVVMGTDCTGSYKSNYHTIRTTTAPNFFVRFIGMKKTQNLYIMQRIIISKLILPSWGWTQ